jgi:hypothetical protein
VFCGKRCAEEEDGSVVYLSSSFMLRVKDCVGVDGQLLYGVINKCIVLRKGEVVVD